jgi:hypothetical protein
VSLGEHTPSDVARNRNLDPSALLAANPNISDLYARLSTGQERSRDFADGEGEKKRVT